ncbi:MAG TPA: cytochrome oxidase subunit III, partial [Vicinamibacteria bacterium]|nr:cytochrome oxidase subunit III [Vicinamibacteria bacterium]
MSNTAAAMTSPLTGTASPFGVAWQKLMMWIFIVTDALLFAGLLVGYGVVRVASPTWPEQSVAFNMNYITLMTFTLITSSATM